jgi:hypothetical protein
MNSIKNLWFNLLCFIEDYHRLLEILLTFTAIVVAYCLLNKTTEQVDRMRDANKIAHNAMQYQRRMDSVNGIKQDQKDKYYKKSQEERDSLNKLGIKFNNRAYIQVDSISYKIKEFTYSIYYSNRGKTPAYKVTIISNTKLETMGINNIDFKNLKKSSKADSTTYYLGAEQPLFTIYSFKNKLLNFNFNDIDNQRKSWYIWGIISYKDIFGDYHKTKFCSEFDIVYKRFKFAGDCNETD